MAYLQPVDDFGEYQVEPHNIDAEQALIGAIMITNEAYQIVSTFLNADHFFEPLHMRIYEACAHLIAQGVVADPITLKSYMDGEPKIQGPDIDYTVAGYLAHLSANACTTISATGYGQTIHDLAVRRRLSIIGEEIARNAYNSPIDYSVTEQISQAENELYELSSPLTDRRQAAHISTAVAEALDVASRAYQRDGSLAGLSTGLADLDSKLGGLAASDLIIIAGRPSMAKTSLATNIAYSNVLRQVPVGFFSLEMSSVQLANRIISQIAKISSEKIRRGEITEEQFRELSNAGDALQCLPLTIDETGGLSIGELAARARRMQKRQGIELLVIDYLQLMVGSKTSSSRVHEITEITMGLKALAKELNIPIIAISQLSRQVEARANKRPQLADLRDSGSIEQDADVVLFLYREEYYLQREKPLVDDIAKYSEWQGKMDKYHALAEIIIGKQRHGPTGMIQARFNAELTHFSTLSYRDHPGGLL